MRVVTQAELGIRAENLRYNLPLEPAVAGVALEGRDDALELIGGLSSVALSGIEPDGFMVLESGASLEIRRSQGAEAISLQASLLQKLLGTADEPFVDGPFTFDAQDSHAGRVLAKAVNAANAERLARLVERPIGRFIYGNLFRQVVDSESYPPKRYGLPIRVPDTREI